MADPSLSLNKIAIKGATLASIIQRFSASSSDVDGLLFGHVTSLTDLPNDDVPSSSAATTTTKQIATVTNFFCSGAAAAFYDSVGRLNSAALSTITDPSGPYSQSRLLGWFVGRRRTPLRPSLRERLVTASLAAKFPSCPLVFMVFTTSPSDHHIHTHEHRAFQFDRGTGKFEVKSVEIVNVGPAFRPHYEEFKPDSRFPMMGFGGSGAEMEMDDSEEGGDLLEGAEIDEEKLRKLVGDEASGYTSALEDMYEKMVAKMENLSKLVEKSNALVLEQEARNAKLRHKVMGWE